MLFAAALTLVGASASGFSAAAAEAETGGHTGSSGQISLTQLGYGSGLALQGSAPTTTLVFPLPSGGIQSGQLDLHVEAGPAADDQSSLRLVGPDGTAAQVSVAELRQNGVLTLPLGATLAGPLAVQVTRTNIGDDGACPPAAEADSGAWLRVLPDSSLRYQPAQRPDTPGGVCSTTWRRAGRGRAVGYARAPGQ